MLFINDFLPQDGAVALHYKHWQPTVATAKWGARKETSACMRQHPKQDKLSLPVFLCECVGVSVFYYNWFMSHKRTPPWTLPGYETDGFAHTHIWLYTHAPHVGMLEFPVFAKRRNTHARTSRSWSISLSFCSSRPSSWWMVISASASRLVRSWSSSVARDDRPLLCNISSNFFMDSSL